MIERPKFYRQKDVLLVTDIPTRKEIEEGDKFSSQSNLSLFTSLRTGRANVFNNKPVAGFTGVNSLDIHATYLDFSYNGEPDIDGNEDFKKDFKKRADLQEMVVHGGTSTYLVEKDVHRLTENAIPTSTWYKLEHKKDLYISYRLKECVDLLIYEIKEVKPKIVVCVGKWSLFFLSGDIPLAKTKDSGTAKKILGGLSTHRASVMTLWEGYGIEDTILYPMYHTQNSIIMPESLPIIELDIQKLGYMYHDVLDKGVDYFLKPDKEYIGTDDKEIVLRELEGLLKVLDKPTYVSIDTETMFSSFIDCIGFAIDKDRGFCVPLAKADNPLIWTEEEEVEICSLIFKILSNKNCLHIGQNYPYDTTFYNKLWCLDITASLDTMLLHHTLYAYLPKDLAFLASVYCQHYTWWKGELTATKEAPETRWIYNAKDVCYTYEIAMVLKDVLESCPDTRLQSLYKFQQEELTPELATMMYSGVRIDKGRKEELYHFFHNLLSDIELKIKDVLGEDFNLNSPIQKKKIFKDLLGMKLEKVKGKETTNAASMLEYIANYPLYKPFLTLLLEHSSLKVFTNNFLGMELDEDDRARTQYKITGTATGRLSSTKNIWGKGGNFQNIPEKGKIDLRQAVELVDDSDDLAASLEVEGSIKLPNIKKIFLPDEGMEIADGDYSGADIQIVAADSECKWLLDYFENPKGCGKVYAYIASEFFQREVSPESSEYKVYKGILHGTNYLMGTGKLAIMAGIPIEQAEELQNFYFYLNPEVRVWQNRIRKEIREKGYITNCFGRRGWYLNTKDPMLDNKAAAFIPQSTIGDLVNRALVRIRREEKNIQIKLQVHDSLVVQYPVEDKLLYRKKVVECMQIELPYGITIPADIKTSTVSYGDCKKEGK